MLAVGALLPIVDPLGGAPIYLAMTANLTSARAHPHGEIGGDQQLSAAHRLDVDRRLCARLLRPVDSRRTGRRRHRGLHDRVVAAQQSRYAARGRTQRRPGGNARRPEPAGVLPDDHAADRRTRVDLRRPHARGQSARGVSIRCCSRRWRTRSASCWSLWASTCATATPIAFCANWARPAPASWCGCLHSSCCASGCRSAGTESTGSLPAGFGSNRLR